MRKIYSVTEDSDWSDSSDSSGYTKVELYPNGRYRSLVPSNDTDWIIMGRIVKLKGGMSVTFHKNELVASCFLAETTTLAAYGVSVRVRGQKVLEFHQDGNFRVLTLGHQKAGFLKLKGGWIYRGKKYNPGLGLMFSTTGDVIAVF